VSRRSAASRAAAAAPASAPRPARRRTQGAQPSRAPASAGTIAASEQELTDWVRHTPEIACFFDAQGKLLAASEAFARKFGRSAATPRVDLNTIVHAEDRPAFANALQVLRQGTHRFQLELRCRTSQGWRWIAWESEACFAPSGAFVAARSVGRDTTRQHLAEEKSFILTQAVEQSPVALALADAEGRIRYVNQRYCELVGTSLEDLLESAARLFRDNHPTEEAYQEFLAQLRTGRPWRGEVCGRDRHGQPRWEAVQVSGIRGPGGSVTHLLMLREDITERKHLEEQLRQAQKMESIGTLAGGIAHDFNNLLSIINGYAEILLARTPPGSDEKTHRQLGEIFKAGQRAVGLVRQILTFSRKADVLFAPLDLNQLVTDIGGMLQETFPRTIAFRFELAEGLRPLLADQNQIQQVVMNLCVNARDAMAEGGTLSLVTRRVPGRALARFGADPARAFVALSVSDTGTGMPPEVLRRVFEPFFTTKEKGHGTGLGLAVVEGIVSRHGGYLDVASEVGHGSTFTLYLPETRCADPDGIETAAEADAALERGSGRVLVVEDEPSLRTMACGVLAGGGYTVAEVADGAQALELLERDPHCCDALLLDVNMPRLNGLSVYQVVRRRFPHLKVVVVSGYLTQDVKDQFREHGPVIFLNKPFRVDEVLSRMHEALSQP
jgi:two-component system cell cycle sensor histidine kinase/response regulator CckA